MLTTLALAVGVNLAILTLVNRVVLEPLPYPESDRLIDLDHAATAMNVPSGVAMTLGLYALYQDDARTLDGIALPFRGGDELRRAIGDAAAGAARAGAARRGYRGRESGHRTSAYA